MLEDLGCLTGQVKRLHCDRKNTHYANLTKDDCQVKYNCQFKNRGG